MGDPINSSMRSRTDRLRRGSWALSGGLVTGLGTIFRTRPIRLSAWLSISRIAICLRPASTWLSISSDRPVASQNSRRVFKRVRISSAISSR